MKCNEEKAKQLEKLVERDEESQVWLPQKKMDDPVPPRNRFRREEGRWSDPPITSPRIGDQVRRK